MTAYDLWGTLSSLLFGLTLYGLWVQLRLILRRRAEGQRPMTERLSVNQFLSSYFAFYGNCLFGLAVPVLNHYLVWTRLAALLLVVQILFWMAHERRSRFSIGALLAALLCLVAAVVAFWVRPLPGLLPLTNGLILVMAAVLVQGTLHQCYAVWRARSPGVLSKRMLAFTLTKDASTLAFALTMPLHQSWPLLVLNGASIVTRGGLLALVVSYRRPGR